MKKLALRLIRLYQLTISRSTMPNCRFEPTCSHYTAEAVAKFGLVKGIWLGCRRLSRCHPLSAGGYDPVP
jgi:uncharacterized protein